MIISNIIDIVYPRRCPVCHDIVYDKGKLCCNSCKEGLRYVEDPFCVKCGKQLFNPEKCLCSDCTTKSKEFEMGRAVFIYDDVIKKSIYRFKYGGRKEYARFYAAEIYAKYNNLIKRWNPDVIIPIPLHKSKQKKRGYNQADLIAKELSNLTNIPRDNKILFRVKKTEIQKNLGVEGRDTNLKNAFKMRPNGVQYLSAMLIDDIYTTGATMSNATRVLIDGGFEKVYCLSISIGLDS